MKKLFLMIVSIYFVDASLAIAEPLKLIGLNEGSLEIHETDDLSKGVNEKIEWVLKRQRKPGKYVFDQHLEVLLKDFQLTRKAKLVTLGKSETRDIEITGANLFFKEKGDCSNYPEKYFILAFRPKTEGYGFLLPEGAKLIQGLTKADKEKYKKQLIALIQSTIQRSAADRVRFEDLILFSTADGNTYGVFSAPVELVYILKFEKDKLSKIGELALPRCGG